MDCCEVVGQRPEGSSRRSCTDATLRRGEVGWRRTSTAGAVAVALLPKCPACWSAYAGLSSLLGVSFVVQERWLLPLTALCLALALAALGVQARRTRRHGPCALACAAALLTLGGKFALDSDALLYGGIGSLLVASLWGRSSPARA